MTTDATDTPQASVRHNPGCTRPNVRAKVGRLGDTLYRCETCRGLYVERNGTAVPNILRGVERPLPAPLPPPAPTLRDVARVAERFGVPLGCLDEHGALRIVRTLAEYDAIRPTTAAATAARKH